MLRRSENLRGARFIRIWMFEKAKANFRLENRTNRVVEFLWIHVTLFYEINQKGDLGVANVTGR